MKRNTDNTKTLEPAPEKFSPKCYALFYLGGCPQTNCHFCHRPLISVSEIESFVLQYRSQIVRDFEAEKNPDPALKQYILTNLPDIVALGKGLKRVKTTESDLNSAHR